MSDPKILPRDSFKKAKITNIVSGIAGPVAFNLVGGVILVKYVLDLGLGREILGILHMVITVSVILQFLGAYLVEKSGKKRRTFLVFGLLRWAPVLFIFTVPLIPAEYPNMRLILLCLIYLTRGFMTHLCSPGWYNLMNDIVPANKRSRFWSIRRILAGLSSAAAIFVFSRLIDFFKQSGKDFTGYHIAFATAILFGIVDNIIHVILPEKPIDMKDRKSVKLFGEIKKTAVSVFSDSGMRSFFIYYCVLFFQGNLFMLTFRTYCLDEDFLGFSVGLMGVYSSIIMGLSVAGYFLWGRIGDQFGYKLPIIFNLIMRFIMITPWIFITRDNYQSLVWIWIGIGGLFNVGLFLNTTTMMHGLVPERRRAHHMAFLLAFPTLAGSIAGAFFSLAANVLKGQRIVVAGLDISDIKALFPLILLLNVVLLCIATRLRAPKGKKAARIFRGFYMSGGFRTIWNVMVSGFNVGEEQKIERTKRIGAMENPIAVGQLILGLKDPSFRVRQESAWGLGRVSDEHGRRALETVLKNPEAMIHDEAVWSLGKIGNEKSIDVLLPFLKSDDSGFRARVVLALGDIRSPRAVGPLMELLENEGDNFVRECIFDSLAILEDPGVLPELVRSLGRAEEGLSRSHMAMSTGIYIDGKKDEFYKLLAKNRDEKGSLGNSISRDICTGLKALGMDNISEQADVLGDFFWKGRYEKVVNTVLEFFKRTELRTDVSSKNAEIILSTADNMTQEEMTYSMEFAAVLMYSYSKLLIMDDNKK